MKTKIKCCHCWNKISDQEYRFSIQHFEIPMCISCQEDFKTRIQKATPVAIKLYKELKKKGIPAELEKWDGHKTIDIAVVQARLNIEVDGRHHNSSGEQALADLERTVISFKKGYYTLRIPNSLVDFNLERTTDLITEFVLKSIEQLAEEDDDDWDEYEDVWDDDH